MSVDDTVVIPYGTIFLLVASTSLFAVAAEQHGRSREIGILASLCAWFVFTRVCMGGLVGGIVSQIVLFVLWWALDLAADWWQQRRQA